ncbi:MAG: prepilin-type N-terminal cleavage/methylation domain-containing protein [Pseudomonadota bacterium]
MKKSSGFTLIEMAIVLVVVAFLLGAVVQGQKMFYNARIQRIVSDLKDYSQGFILYYDRYGMYPGDENDTGFPSGDTLNGDHDGVIDSSEPANVWEDLANALGVVQKTSPIRGGTYTFGSRSFFGTASQNFISVNNLPNQMAQSIDSRHDDGVYDTGNIQSSVAYDGSETLITLYWRT